MLYHFPTRDALVAAMVDRIIERVRRRHRRLLPEPGTPEADRPGPSRRAYVRATLEPAAPGQETPGCRPVLAAAAAEPALLVPLQEAADRWQARLVDDGLDPALATVIRLACDGLWLCDLFGLASPPGPCAAGRRDASGRMAEERHDAPAAPPPRSPRRPTPRSGSSAP